MSKVKKTLAAPAIKFPAKDPILFGSDLHFLPHRLTGKETYRIRLDVRWQVSFECIKPLTLARSVYLNLSEELLSGAFKMDCCSPVNRMKC